MVSSAAAPALWDYQLANCEPAAARAETALRADLTADKTRFRAVAPPRGPSLDRMIARLWQEITSHHQVTCPWCEGDMRPQYGVASRPVRARCTDCGATLS